MTGWTPCPNRSGVSVRVTPTHVEVTHHVDDFTVLSFSHAQWETFIRRVRQGELPGLRKHEYGERWANPIEYHWERGDDTIVLSPPEVAALRESLLAGVFDLGGRA